MAKKTVIRRLAKRLPMSTDLETVVRRDDDLMEYADATPTPPPPRLPQQSRVKNMMGIAAPTPTVEAEPPAPALPPPADMDPETGEVMTAPEPTLEPPADQDTDLHLAIRECETMADLNRLMADIAKLKNGRREKAIAVFNARKEQIGKKG